MLAIAVTLMGSLLRRWSRLMLEHSAAIDSNSVGKVLSPRHANRYQRETVSDFSDSRGHLRAAVAAALLAAVAAALLLLPAPAPAADPPTTAVTSAAKAPSTLSELQDAAEQARLQMRRLEKQMRTIAAARDAALARLTAVSAQLVETRVRLARTQAEVERQSSLISARVVNMYKRTDYTWFDFLFSSDGLADWRSQVEFFDRILEQDRRAGDGLERLNRTAQDCELAIADQREEAVLVHSEIDAQASALDQRIEERRAVLVDLTDRIKVILDRRGFGSTALDLAAAASGNYSPLTWARALLQRLDMPVSADNVAALVAWEMAEGGHWHNTAHYNPLNTTQPMPGATGMNSVGVKAYTSWAQGFQATFITLHNGYYGRILEALRRGDDAIAVAVAVGASPWGTGNFSNLL